MYRRILVPVSGLAGDRRAIDLAAAICSSGETWLTLVYVVEVPQRYALDSELPDQIEQGTSVLEAAASYAQKVARGRWKRITTELLQARVAAAAIVDEAIERAADAIIMATTSRWHLGVLTQGETLPYILDNAPCDVVVIRVASESETRT
ncbi:universal stress protein [Thermomicrobiaceae bacterium CFH 74404]|uniref:Universal stress protein n=1 Tax=Thermalbibacter longus TaxID=2951981 RepID=A0AA41WCP2_9BACT|nr:universal stress protein [Thermalbibacter longus]MCM8748598.1 universal stress protein [Thermalbibacter longus]